MCTQVRVDDPFGELSDDGLWENIISSEAPLLDVSTSSRRS